MRLFKYLPAIALLMVIPVQVSSEGTPRRKPSVEGLTIEDFEPQKEKRPPKPKSKPKPKPSQSGTTKNPVEEDKVTQIPSPPARMIVKGKKWVERWKGGYMDGWENIHEIVDVSNGRYIMKTIFSHNTVNTVCFMFEYQLEDAHSYKSYDCFDPSKYTTSNIKLLYGSEWPNGVIRIGEEWRWGYSHEWTWYEKGKKTNSSISTTNRKYKVIGFETRQKKECVVLSVEQEHTVPASGYKENNHWRSYYSYKDGIVIDLKHEDGTGLEVINISYN